MKRIAVLVLWAALAGSAAAQSPTPLTVGSVRDQGGEPVAGAKIVLFDAKQAPVGNAVSDADGTFAVTAPGAALARVSCPYCSRAEFAVTEGEPIVAIVHRFSALLHDSPTARDIDALPYAHIEAAASLTPFVVFSDSSDITPGPVLADRGLSRAGGLVLDRGVPDYDVAANISPFLSIPSRAITEISELDASDAYRYGDRADAGTLVLSPRQDASNVLAAVGSDGIAQLHVAGRASNADASYSANALERRGRIDLETSAPISDGSISAAVSLARGTLAPYPNDVISTTFGSARVSAQSTRAQRRYAEFTLDRGTYGIWKPGLSVGAQWSDALLRAGIEGVGATRAFVETSVRRSNGYYDAADRLPTIAAAIDQSQFTAGLRAQTARSDLKAGVSLFDIAFKGGPTEPEYAASAVGASTTLVTPSLQFELRPDDAWSVSAVAASTFRLPTLLERYALPPVPNVLTIDRNTLMQMTVNFTDRARVRASATGFKQYTTGFDSGEVSGIGGSLSWQVSPRLVARTWWLRETDTTAPVVRIIRFTPARIAATVGSAWLTYEAQTWRADAIFRRDLMDRTTFAHLDFSISSQLSKSVRWFAGSEVRHGQRYVDAGVRLSSP